MDERIWDPRMDGSKLSRSSSSKQFHVHPERRCSKRNEEKLGKRISNKRNSVRNLVRSFVKQDSNGASTRNNEDRNSNKHTSLSPDGLLLHGRLRPSVEQPSAASTADVNCQQHFGKTGGKTRGTTPDDQQQQPRLSLCNGSCLQCPCLHGSSAN